MILKKFLSDKGSANQIQYKISLLIFIVEMPPTFFVEKGHANRTKYKKNNYFCISSIV